MIEYLRHQHTAHICLDLGWIEEEKYQKWYAENALGAIFARIDAFHFDTLCNFNIETGSQNTIGSQKNPGYSKPRSLKVFKISPYLVGTMVDFWRQIQYIATWEIGFHSCVNGNSIFGQTLLAIVKKRWHKENMLTNLWLDTWSVKFAISWEFSTKSLPRNQFLLIGIWFWNVTWYNLT